MRRRFHFALGALVIGALANTQANACDWGWGCSACGYGYGYSPGRYAYYAPAYDVRPAYATIDYPRPYYTGPGYYAPSYYAGPPSVPPAYAYSSYAPYAPHYALAQGGYRAAGAPNHGTMGTPPIPSTRQTVVTRSAALSADASRAFRVVMPRPAAHVTDRSPFGGALLANPKQHATRAAAASAFHAAKSSPPSSAALGFVPRGNRGRLEGKAPGAKSAGQSGYVAAAYFGPRR
jgi:hypothetical protein